MTISGLPPLVPMLPARAAAAPAPSRSEGGQELQGTATPSRATSLWQVLTPDEKAFFLGASSSMAIGYGPEGQSPRGAGPMLGQHLDVTA